MTRAVILVPRREGFRDRDRLWAFCRAWWLEHFPELELVEGHHTEGLFNRSKAVNRAAAQAGEWDVAVLIDADVLCDPEHVREAIRRAAIENLIVVPFTVRHNLNPRGTERVMAGYNGPWEPFIARNYYDQHSSVIAIPRALWDTVGGFDEGFDGWGWEDTAFAIAATELVGPLEHMDGEVWHLHHAPAPEARFTSKSFTANRARGARYQAAQGNPDAIRALIDGSAPAAAELFETSIPQILHRVVPVETSAEVEAWWKAFEAMHPGWRMMTHRDPLVPSDWPMTSPVWRYCDSGASLADLVRLEALYRFGGIYVDSDVEPWRPFDPLLPLEAFAAWEDERTVPNAVMGARREHPAIKLAIDAAVEAIRKRRGTWNGGPGVTTKIFVGRSDVLLFPPGTFYAVHYRDPERDAKMSSPATRQSNPWAFALHHYAGSWLKRDEAAS